MEKLRNRKTAAVIAAVVIVASTLLGTRQSVAKATARVERLFYDGVLVGTYVEPGIATHLEVRENASNGLITLAKDHPELARAAEKLTEARRQLVDAGSISQKAEANRLLQAAYVEYLEVVKTVSLDDRERNMLETYTSQMDNAQREIGESAYNLKVDELRRQLETFPVSILRRVTFAPYPQNFE